MTRETLSSFARLARSSSTLRTGLRISLVVGTGLNLINQGDVILEAEWGSVNWIKLGLTYCVPFCVSVYSITTARLRFSPGTRSPRRAHLICKGCQTEHRDVEPEDWIDDCPRCRAKTEWRSVS